MSIIEALQNTFLDKEASDLKIVCDNEEIHCHKVILSQRSDVFKAMFCRQNSYTEIKEGILKIEDISAKTMKTFLKYIYTDFIEIEEIDCDLLYAANKYNFKRLVSECLKHLRYSINNENVIVIIMAAFLLDKDDLIMEAMKVLKENGTKDNLSEWNELLKECPGLSQKISNLLLFG